MKTERESSLSDQGGTGLRYSPSATTTNPSPAIGFCWSTTDTTRGHPGDRSVQMGKEDLSVQAADNRPEKRERERERPSSIHRPNID